MSTELYNLKNDSKEINIVRVCGPACESVDRIRMSIMVAKSDNILGGSQIILNRKQWQELKIAVDAGFAEFPVCEICEQKADSYAEDFIAGAGKLCSDCYKNGIKFLDID